MDAAERVSIKHPSMCGWGGHLQDAPSALWQAGGQRACVCAYMRAAVCRYTAAAAAAGKYKCTIRGVMMMLKTKEVYDLQRNGGTAGVHTQFSRVSLPLLGS